MAAKAVEFEFRESWTPLCKFLSRIGKVLNTVLCGVVAMDSKDNFFKLGMEKQEILCESGAFTLGRTVRTFGFCEESWPMANIQLDSVVCPSDLQVRLQQHDCHKHRYGQATMYWHLGRSSSRMGGDISPSSSVYIAVLSSSLGSRMVRC